MLFDIQLMGSTFKKMALSRKPFLEKTNFILFLDQLAKI